MGGGFAALGVGRSVFFGTVCGPCGGVCAGSPRNVAVCGRTAFIAVCARGVGPAKIRACPVTFGRGLFAQEFSLPGMRQALGMVKAACGALVARGLVYTTCL